MKKIVLSLIHLLLSVIVFAGSASTINSCEGVPEGYESMYCLDFETTEDAGAYIGNDAWYFYDGGSASQNSGAAFSERFKIVTNPTDPNSKCLKQIKYDGDEDYSNSGLNPRTELSFRPSLEISVDKEIYYRIKTYFPSNQANIFSAEFIQFWLHGSSNIPMQIEVRNGHFAKRRPGVDKYPNCDNCGFANGALSDNLDRWITWEVKAKFTNTGGYWEIYMDGDLVYTQTDNMTDWPSETNGTWHPQFGVYSNQTMNGDMEVLFDDFMIAEYTGQIITPPTETIITGISLINADDESTISGYDDMTTVSTIEKSALTTTQFNIYADVTGPLDSVEFVYNLAGVEGRRKEGGAPYALRGDGTGYSTWAMETGSYEITVNVYYLGILKDSETIIFDVVEGIYSFSPIHDAYIQGATPYNTSELRVEDGNRVTYLQFNIDNISNQIESATMQLTVAADDGNGTLRLFSGDSNNWTEDNITVNNAPQILSEVSQLSGTFSPGDVLEFDVSSVITRNGMYSFILQLDAGGNDVSFESSESTHSPLIKLYTNDAVITTQNINLQTGWNLISTNVIPADATIETLFTGLDVDIVKDADSFWKSGQVASLNSLTTITSGEAYLVKMNTLGTLTLTGSETLSGLPTPISGWQMVGCPFQTTTTLDSHFTGVETEVVKDFDGFYEPNGTTNSITNLEPGKGYFVKGK